MSENCFAGLHSLKTLKIGANRLTEEVFSRLSVLSSTLEYLGMNANDFSSLHQEQFVEIMKSMRVLEKLTLSDTRLTTLPDFYHNNGNFSLQFIDIDFNPLVCDENLVWLKDVEEDPCLNTRLGISPCEAPVELKNREWGTLTRKELDPPGETCLFEISPVEREGCVIFDPTTKRFCLLHMFL